MTTCGTQVYPGTCTGKYFMDLIGEVYPVFPSKSVVKKAFKGLSSSLNYNKQQRAKRVDRVVSRQLSHRVLNFMMGLVNCVFNRGTQRQFFENICSEDDLRTRIFETFVVKFPACLPLQGFSNI